MCLGGMRERWEHCADKICGIATVTLAAPPHNAHPGGSLGRGGGRSAEARGEGGVACRRMGQGSKGSESFHFLNPFNLLAKARENLKRLSPWVRMKGRKPWRRRVRSAPCSSLHVHAIPRARARAACTRSRSRAHAERRAANPAAPAPASPPTRPSRAKTQSPPVHPCPQNRRRTARAATERGAARLRGGPETASPRPSTGPQNRLQESKRCA
jgi:hypothetical protein